MTSSPFDKHRQSAASSSGFTGFTTLDQMLDECERRNDQRWVKEMDRWYFVVPASQDGVAHIESVEGVKAIQMRASYEGRGQPEWKPEPGETEWIKRATAEYIQRHPSHPSETPEQVRAKFSETMNRWAAAKPWRRAMGEAA